MDTSSNGTGLVRTYKNNVVNQMITEDQSTYSDGFLDFNKHYVTNRQTKTGSTDVSTLTQLKLIIPLALILLVMMLAIIRVLTLANPNTSTVIIIINNSHQSGDRLD